MRIIGGKWAGRDLTSPSGRVRPTAEALRGALLDELSPDLPKARVLDLFAGTGALGLEAMSRGALSCDFVENGPAALHALKANVAALRVRERSRIFVKDAIPFVERIDKAAYDVAFADPPYESQKLDRVLKRWLAQPFSRILAVEHAAAHELPRPGRTRRFEDSAYSIYRMD